MNLSRRNKRGNACTKSWFVTIQLCGIFDTNSGKYFGMLFKVFKMTHKFGLLLDSFKYFVRQYSDNKHG